MKIVKILTAFAAVCALVIGCVKENPNVWNEIQVSSSYIGLTNGEGSNSKTITVKATDSWNINSMPQWLSISPASGGAGETAVTFSAGKASQTRNAVVKIVCAGREQSINVLQQAEKVEPKTLSVAEAIEICSALADKDVAPGDYRVKGIVCSIVDLSVQYGNVTFWISDDGKNESGKNFEVYRALWLNGASFKAGDNLDIGDEVIIEGKIMKYGTTPETKEKEAYVYQINKSLIKCDSLVVNGVKSNVLPIEGGDFEAVLTCKGNGVSVVIPDKAKSWLSVTGITTAGSAATVSFHAARNDGGDRSTELTFSTISEGREYNASAAVSQTGAIIEASIAEYLAAAEDNTQYRISGIITSVAQDSEKYGANLYIQDATGTVYIYGTTDAEGTIQTLASFGAKVGDIIEFVGTRSSYKGTPQMAKGKFQWYKSVTPATAAQAASLADDNKADPQNYIQLTGKVVKNSGYDIEPYGNFDLVDETGSILIYGVSTGWNGETKKFGTLGVKEGDVITIVGYKTSYKNNPQVVGMYVSHEEGGSEPEQPAETSEYSIDVTYSLGASAYDDGAATVNGTEVAKTVKIGTSSKVGDFSVEIPASCTKLSFYAVAWKGVTDAVVEIYDGETVVASQSVAGNDGASGNAPYTLTVTDADKYSLNVPAGKTVKVTSNKRVIFFGIKAE